jgi:hypothetical protein
MTATKPTSTSPVSPVYEKAVKATKKAVDAKLNRAVVAENNSIDTLLQGVDKHRRYARRGSQTPSMLNSSASRLVFDSEGCSSTSKVESETGMTLVKALRLKIRKDSKKYLNPGSH